MNMHDDKSTKSVKTHDCMHCGYSATVNPLARGAVRSAMPAAIAMEHVMVHAASHVNVMPAANLSTIALAMSLLVSSSTFSTM